MARSASSVPIGSDFSTISQQRCTFLLLSITLLLECYTACCTSRHCVGHVSQRAPMSPDDGIPVSHSFVATVGAGGGGWNSNKPPITLNWPPIASYTHYTRILCSHFMIGSHQCSEMRLLSDSSAFSFPTGDGDPSPPPCRFPNLARARLAASQVEVAKRFLNPRNLGILWHSVCFLAVRFCAFSPWSLNRFLSSFSNSHDVLTYWEANCR